MAPSTVKSSVGGEVAGMGMSTHSSASVTASICHNDIGVGDTEQVDLGIDRFDNGRIYELGFRDPGHDADMDTGVKLEDHSLARRHIYSACQKSSVFIYMGVYRTLGQVVSHFHFRRTGCRGVGNAEYVA